MESQTPVLLSICISTLDRANYIGETLESMVGQICDGVEIIVLDAVSKDNTAEVVGRYAARCPQLRYIRWERSVGVDEKYAAMGELAAGEYCWFFADDDVLKPGAVAAVLHECKKNFSFIAVNAEVRNPDLTVCLQERRVRIDRDRIYGTTAADWDSLFADLGVFLSFIGGVVLKRQIWDQRDKKKYFGTQFIHLGVLFQSPLPGTSLAMAHPWIVIRYGMGQWRPQSFELWMFKFPALVWSFPGLSDSAKERVEVRQPWTRWYRLLMARAMGHYSLREYRDYIVPRTKPSLQKLIARVIASLPVGLLNFLARFLVGIVLRKSPSMTLFELEESRR